jgi:Probable cobalt transporter subunit (CbtB)
MERTVASWGWVLPEPILFLLKAGVFLCASGVILYVALASSYPAVHDTLHNFRHALAVVPCH